MASKADSFVDVCKRELVHQLAHTGFLARRGVLFELLDLLEVSLALVFRFRLCLGFFSWGRALLCPFAALGLLVAGLAMAAAWRASLRRRLLRWSEFSLGRIVRNVSSSMGTVPPNE